jgi:hypothetical protein
MEIAMLLILFAALIVVTICFFVRMSKLQMIMGKNVKAKTQYFPKNVKLAEKVFAFALYDDRVEYRSIDFLFMEERIVFPFNDIDFCVMQDRISLRRISNDAHMTVGFSRKDEQDSWSLFLQRKVPNNGHITVVGDNNTYIAGDNNRLTIK